MSNSIGARTVRVPLSARVTVACVMSCAFSILAAAEKPEPTAEPAREPSSQSNENAEETVPREFLGFADVSVFRGVIDDPDGYVNLRKDKRVDAPVVTNVKAGEIFQFKKKEGDGWCQVKLKSGVSGWMHCSRIKLFFNKDDLPPKREKGDEIDDQAREQGVNYYDVTQAAAGGDPKALKTFLTLSTDGAGAEEHQGVMCVVLHLIGDDAFAKFLREQTRGFCDQLSLGGDLSYPFDPDEYFRQHFPKTTRILSPDYDQLIREYTRAIKSNPEDSQAYRERGIAEYEKDDWDRALPDLDRAIELNPKDDRAYWKRGGVHVEKEEYDSAINDLQKAIEISGRYLAAYYIDLGTCQLYNRKPREAIAASLKALELTPENAVLIKTNLAHGYLFDNQFDKAKAIYLENKAAKLPYGQQGFSEEVLDDFKQFREAGLTHPDTEKIEALLTGKTEQSDQSQGTTSSVRPATPETKDSDKP
jgi:tetratricopeptide (TPR) repeat protein